MRRVVIIDYQLFASDVADELRLLDFEVFYITHQDIQKLDLSLIIEKIKPYFLFTINFSPEIAFLCSKYQTFYVSWTVDPLPPSRFQILQGTLIDNTIVFCHRTEDVEKFLNKGLKNVHHLILGASRNRFINKQLNGFKYEVSFVGVSLYKEIDEFYKYLSILSIDKNIVIEILLKDYEQVIANEKVFDEILGEVPNEILGLIQNIETINLNYLSQLINGFYSCYHRIKTVKEIEGISVFGDEYWREIGVKYLGIANHKEELNNIYQMSKLNFDISRFYQKSSINMRVFDSMACGGVVLTQQNSEIDKIFEKNIHYIDFKDKFWRDNLQDFKKINGIKLKALKEIDNYHRIEHRIKTILSII